MALDLFLGIIKKNWARDAADGSPQAAAPPATLVLTADEKDWLGRIAVLKMRAESGDRKSRKQWKRLARKANALRTKARKGDPRAGRMIAVLDQSGLLGSVQRISGDAEPRDQDIVEKLILRAGNATGWPTMISRDRYADYERRAGQGDQRSREVMAILTRYINAGRVKVSDGKKTDPTLYPIGNDKQEENIKDPSEAESLKHIKNWLNAKKEKNSSIWDQEEKWFWNNYWDTAIKGGTSPGSRRIIFSHPRLHPVVVNCQDSTLNNCEIKVLKHASPVDWRAAQDIQTQALKNKQISRKDFNLIVSAALQDPEADQASKAAAAEKMLKFLASRDVTIKGWSSPLLMHGSSFRHDEDRAEGEDSPSCGDDLPHSEYRALVMRKAIRDAGGCQPSTRHLFAAKKAVDNALGSSGVAIYIPGAAPRRRTV